jgi:hypothetical protein
MPGRELLEPTPVDRRHVCREAKGRFKEVDGVELSSAADQRQKAKNNAMKAQDDRRDRRD